MKLLCISALAAVLALSGAAAPGSAQTTLATIKIATTPIDIGAEPFFADDMGFFKKNGLDAQTQIIQNGGAIVAAVLSGAIDVAQSNIVSLATAHEKGLPLVIIAPAGLYSYKAPTSVLVVPKNSPIKTAKDLNGKIVAGNGLKNISEIGPEAWMDQNGGDSTTIKFVEMPFPTMGAALEAGRIDAALITEPDLSDVLQHGNRILGNAYDGIAKDFLVGGWFTTAAWAKAHPDLVKKFQAAIRETAQWANANQSKSAPILTKYTKIVVAPGMRRALFGDKLDTALIQPVIDASAKHGALKATFPASELLLQ